MRLLQVNKFYDRVGGVERVVRDLAEGFAPDHDVRVLAAVSRGRGGVERRDGVRVRTTASLGVGLSVPLSPTFPLGLRREAADAEVLHYHLPNPLGPVAHGLARPDRPTVATYHADVVRQAAAFRAYEPLLHRFLDACDRITVTSPRLRDRSPVLRRHREACEVVPLSVDVDRVTAPGDPPPLPDGPVVLFVGRLTYYKGVEHLIDAMAGVDATLVVAGGGERRGALERRAERRDGAQVRFLGHVPDDRLRGLYRRADVFVLPSTERSEAFGIVQLEAMANGLPVINTDLPTGVPWVSRDGETGLTVPPGDPDALKDAIVRLLTDDDLRRRLGSNARDRVRDRFTRDRMLDRFEAVYRSVTGR